jgi:uncharacterized membrane protein YkoI
MLKRTLLALSVAAATALSVVPAALAEAEENEQKVTVDQLPPAVRKTLEKEAAGGKILEIEKERERGKTVYEAQIIKNGQKWEIEIAEDGKVLDREQENDDDD